MVSIIVPTYNRGYIILKSIESLLLQSFQNFEIIIIDDCSTDDTEEKIKLIKDRRIRYIKLKTNEGANKARNIGIENSKYEIIAFQDSDDYWHKTKLEEQLKYLIDGKYDLIGCSYKRFKNGVYKDTFPKQKISKNTNFTKILLNQNFLSTQTILGKKKIFLDEKFDEKLQRFQDWELVIRISKKYKIGFLNKALVDVHLQKMSISTNNEKGLLSLKYILEKYKEDFIKEKEILSNFYAKIYIFSIKIKTNEREYAKLAFTLNKNLKKILLYIISKLKIESLCLIILKLKNFN